MTKYITKAVHKSLLKQEREAVKDKAKTRRKAMAAIAAARAAGHPGRLVLAREDACGEYVMARHHLAQRRTNLTDIYIMQ